MRKILFIPFFIFIAFFVGLATASFGQDTSTLYTDISKVRLVDSIIKTSAYAFVTKETSLKENFSSLHFIRGNPYPKGIPPKMVSKKAVLKFNIINSSDTTKGVYFFPGFYISHYNLYKLENDHLKELPEILPGTIDNISYRYITLPKGDSATIIGEFLFEKTYNNNLRPRFINPIYIEAYISKLHHQQEDLDLVTYVFCGLLLMMILFSIANYIQGAAPEFLYYSGYAFFLGGMLFTKSFYNYRATFTNYFFESYLDLIMLCLGEICYMVFMQKFLETKKNYRFLYRFYNAGIAIMFIAIVIFTYFHFFTNNYLAEYWIETLSKSVLLALAVIFLVYSYRHRQNKLLRYLFWGNLSLFIFSLISQMMISINPKFKHIPSIFNTALLYYELGLLLELIFFFAGLSYKNRHQIIEQTREREQLKTENQKKEYEKELAVYKAQQEERNRISADMHDELGSGMTAIRLMSEIAKNKMKENTPHEIEKISKSADDVLNKMNVIIWSMNSGNDSLGNLIYYIRSYSLEYLDGTPVVCRVLTPDYIPEKELTGDKRRNLFLCVKETLNNVLKHSNASEVKINFDTNEELKIKISDNGKGIDLNSIRQFGNGLQNITRRMNSIGGSFHIENKNGTITTLVLPLD
ncbi:MAG: histidine kinase [Bacteroidota bacterium]|nr:histidine kinase [Bacteroidota bacterium]